MKLIFHNFQFNFLVNWSSLVVSNNTKPKLDNIKFKINIGQLLKKWLVQQGPKGGLFLIDLEGLQLVKN
jgi:hypothetical protein